MENENKPRPQATHTPSPIDGMLAEGELMTLVDLQKFIADELASPDGDLDFSRAFMPVTDGLGLLSPAARGGAAPPSPEPARPRQSTRPGPRPSLPVDDVFSTDPLPARSTPHPAPEKRIDPIDAILGGAEDDEIQPTEQLAAKKSLVAAMETPPPVVVETKPAPAPVVEAPVVTPPPVPAPTFFRRAMAGLLDEIFVLTLWLIAVAITANALGGTTASFSASFVKEFSKPLFLRFAALEFATLWLAYFAIGIGVLDMTFGMWVWGLRVKYPGEASPYVKKVARVLLSFVFFAPIAPLILLAPRAKGRNLLDFLTGTALYRSAL